MDASGKTYVILVNWRNAFDTLECIESLLNQNYPDYQIVVCENGSADQSLEVFKAWAAGELCVAPAKGTPGCSYARQSQERIRPDAYFIQARRTAQGHAISHVPEVCVNARVLFIELPENTGFAGGNNVGLRYALGNGDGEYFWVLNNDTVVAPDALWHLVNKTKDKPKYAMVGATVFHYDQPARIQYSCGAKANRWLATVKPIAEYPPCDENSIIQFEIAVERQVSYVAGASMLLTREFLQRVGLMSEEYFLYYEEQDWVARMPSDLSIGYSARARIYHKEGAAIGGKTVGKIKKSTTAEYYSSRSRIVYTKRFFRLGLVLVIAALLGSVFNRARAGRWASIPVIIKGVVDGLRGQGFTASTASR